MAVERLRTVWLHIVLCVMPAWRWIVHARVHLNQYMRLIPATLVGSSFLNYNTEDPHPITMPRIAKSPPTEDVRLTVLTHVENYAKSLIEPDLGALKANFYDQATIFASFGDATQGGHIRWIFDNMAQNGGITGLQFEVTLLSVTPTTAVAQVQLHREQPAYEITDFVSLVKGSDGSSTIDSKIFQVYQYAMLVKYRVATKMGSLHDAPPPKTMNRVSTKALTKISYCGYG